MGKINMISWMVIKRTTTETIFGVIPSTGNAKDFLVAIWQKFKESDKAETHNV